MNCNHQSIRALNNGACVLCDRQPDELEQIDELDLERSILRDSFSAFVKRFWSTIDAHPYAATIASEAIIAVLQAVADGRCNRLIIEVSPGLGKTTLGALYIGWRFARDPSHRMIGASHAHEIVVTGLSKRARRLIESEDYRSLFNVQLRDDENQMHLWGTTALGRFVAAGVGGALTGHRGSELIGDDLINSVDIHSKASRDATWQWFGESFSTRVDGEGPIVLIGQRLSVDDVAGRLRTSAAAWTILTLADEF